MKEASEIQIERAILDWLTLLGAFACKIHISGKPIRIGKKMIMAPFSNPYHRKAMSDILVFYRGKTFAFEVKTIDEYKFIVRNFDKIKGSGKASERINHLRDQYQFLLSIRKQGGIGEFVCSISEVKEIIERAFQTKTDIIKNGNAQPEGIP
jgi:hypothetical protein